MNDDLIGMFNRYFPNQNNSYMTARSEAVKRDITLAQSIYGNQHIGYDQTLEWIVIYDYKLPSHYNHSVTDVLIVPPPLYGMSNVPLEEFYLDKGLRIRTKSGLRPLPNYHQQSGLNKFTNKGWAWYCIHPMSWNGTDSIITFLKLIEVLLDNPFNHTTGRGL